MKLWQEDLFQGVAFGDVAEEVRLTHKLSQRAARFAFEYPKDNNGTLAAIRSGFSAKTAAQAASRLLKNVKVRAAIDGMIARIHARCEVTAERIRWETACVAFADPRQMLDENGNVKDMKDWPPELARALSGMDVEEVRAAGLKVGIVKKPRFWGKVEALKLLGQEKKMWSPDDGGMQPGRFILVTG